MAILITGGGGFMGSHLVSAFMGRGEKVVVFNRSADLSAPADPDRLVRVRGDISNWHDVLNVVKDHHIENILHLAAMLSQPSEANPWASINTNAMGAYNVLEAARLFGVKKVVMTSSMAVYGATNETVATEDTLQRPTNIYGCCKVFAELLGLYYHRKFGIDFRGIRAPQIVGPGVKTRSLGQFTPWLIEAAIKGEPFEVWVPEDFVQPMLYIKDVIRSFVMLYDAPEERMTTRIYNMGQITPPPTVRELVDEVTKYFPDARISFEPDPAIVPLLKNIPRIFSNDRATEEWGWRPSYSLGDMVRDFIAEFKAREDVI
jgi:nucleoside-diphosphate-sugar epimerase